MSKFYTNFHQARNGKLMVRGYNDGEQFFECLPITPSLYMVDHGSTETGFKNVEGQNLREKTFDNMYQARDFVKQYEGIDSYPIFGYPQFDYTEISKLYPGLIDYNPKHVRTFNFDIEVDGSVEVEPGVFKSGGFPDPLVAKFPINAISVVYDEVCYCFGIGEFDVNKLTEKYELPIVFKEFGDEYSLLLAFLNFWDVSKPDIVTGWNIDTFDIPYLIHRMNQVIGEDKTVRLSPYSNIRSKSFVDGYGRDAITFSITGVAILDYLQLYKKHTFTTRESYKLDHIAFVELGERKIEYDGNLFILYHENPQLFFEYNCKDSILVHRLDRKLGLINLVLGMSYFAKVNYQDTFSPVKTWDVIISSRLADEGVIVPYKIPKSAPTPYEGAYVKSPVPGRTGWGFSVDMNSMYPLNIRSFNIGPDTYIRTEELTPELIKLRQTVISSGVDSLVDMKIDTSVLKKYDYSMAANGEFYRRDKEGIFSRLVEELYEGRKSDKNKMLEAKSKLEQVKTELAKRA